MAMPTRIARKIQKPQLMITSPVVVRGQTPLSLYQFVQLLAEIPPPEHADERRRGGLQALCNALAVPEPACLQPAGQLGLGARPQVQAVRNDEALHADAVHQDRAQVLHRVGLGQVVLRDQAADRYARERVHELQHHVENLTPHVFKADVDTFGSSRPEVCIKAARLVIDAGVETELARYVSALGGAARDSPRAAAPAFRELPR